MRALGCLVYPQSLLQKQKEEQGEPSLFSSASREEAQLRGQLKGEGQGSHPKAAVLWLLPLLEPPLRGELTMALMARVELATDPSAPFPCAARQLADGYSSPDRLQT